MSNCFNLKWEHIKKDQIAIDGTETKNGKPLCVPLNTKCRELLESIEKKSPYVFTYAGRKMRRASNTGWYNALKKAGLDGLDGMTLDILGLAIMCKTGLPYTPCSILVAGLTLTL